MTAEHPAPDRFSATPMWLAHHPPDALNRCSRIGGRAVCRRCAVLYPVALVVLVVGGVTGAADTPAALWAMALLPLPTVVEWWAEHLDRAGYRPRRQVTTTVPAGVALGLGLARYLGDPGDLAFWAMVVVYGGACAAIAAWRFLDQRAP